MTTTTKKKKKKKKNERKNEKKRKKYKKKEKNDTHVDEKDGRIIMLVQRATIEDSAAAALRVSNAKQTKAGQSNRSATTKKRCLCEKQCDRGRGRRCWRRTNAEVAQDALGVVDKGNLQEPHGEEKRERERTGGEREEKQQ